jgi:hypothetical protein
MYIVHVNALEFSWVSEYFFPFSLLASSAGGDGGPAPVDGVLHGSNLAPKLECGEVHMMEGMNHPHTQLHD